MNNVDDIDPNTVFTFAQTEVTRNCTGKIFKKHAKTNIRKFSFSYRSVTPWNALPSKVKFANSTNAFKNKIDNIPNLKQKFFEYDG